MSKPGVIDDNKIAKMVIAVMVKRLGGKVTISQADIDAIAFNRLNEYRKGDGIELEFIEKTVQS